MKLRCTLLVILLHLSTGQSFGQITQIGPRTTLVVIVWTIGLIVKIAAPAPHNEPTVHNVQQGMVSPNEIANDIEVVIFPSRISNNIASMKQLTHSTTPCYSPQSVCNKCCTCSAILFTNNLVPIRHRNPFKKITRFGRAKWDCHHFMSLEDSQGPGGRWRLKYQCME